MSQLELIFYWSTLTLGIVLCGFVFVTGVRRVLPFFAAYTYVLLTSTVCIGLAYFFFGYLSVNSYYTYWATILLNLIARSLAIAELCRYGLHAYRGIWALAWRMLSVLAVLFLAHAALDAWGQPNRLAIYGLTLERDLDIASISILAVLLLIRNYYGLTLESLQRTIAFGICFFCAVDFMNNVVLRDSLKGYLFSWFSAAYISIWPGLKPQIERVNDWYGTISVCSSVVSTGIWCFALRKPLRAPTQAPELLPVEIYREFSPALNLRLRAFNDRLLEMLKP